MTLGWSTIHVIDEVFLRSKMKKCVKWYFPFNITKKFDVCELTKAPSFTFKEQFWLFVDKYIFGPKQKKQKSALNSAY